MMYVTYHEKGDGVMSDKHNHIHEDETKNINASNLSEEEENPGISALKKARRIASEHGISDITLDEINAEISEARKKA